MTAYLEDRPELIPIFCNTIFLVLTGIEKEESLDYANDEISQAIMEADINNCFCDEMSVAHDACDACRTIADTTVVYLQDIMVNIENMRSNIPRWVGLENLKHLEWRGADKFALVLK